MRGCRSRGHRGIDESIAPRTQIAAQGPDRRTGSYLDWLDERDARVPAPPDPPVRLVTGSGKKIGRTGESNAERMAAGRRTPPRPADGRPRIARRQSSRSLYPCRSASLSHCRHGSWLTASARKRDKDRADAARCRLFGASATTEPAPRGPATRERVSARSPKAVELGSWRREVIATKSADGTAPALARALAPAYAVCGRSPRTERSAGFMGGGQVLVK